MRFYEGLLFLCKDEGKVVDFFTILIVGGEYRFIL
jgi:hypothetical protein